MICFCYFCRKFFFFILGVAHNDPFFVQIVPQKTIFKRFYQLFFGTNGLQHQVLILIESPYIIYWKSAKKSKGGVVFEVKFGSNQVQCCEKTKKLALSMGFFKFCMRNAFKSKKYIVVIEIPEWKLKAKIARNTTFEENQD